MAAATREAKAARAMAMARKMGRAARVMATATKRARARKRARRRVRAICNSVFGAPQIICVEPTQKKRSHIRAVTNHKSQICDCDSQTQRDMGMLQYCRHERDRP
jgi:hypothetical protein